MKVTKHLNTLYDFDMQHLFEGLTSHPENNEELNIKAMENKLRASRMKFLNKVILASLELITCEESHEVQNVYNKYQTQEATHWIEKVNLLGNLWNIESDFLTRQQVTLFILVILLIAYRIYNYNLSMIICSMDY